MINRIEQSKHCCSLAGVLHARGDTLHGDDESILQSRRVLAGRVQLDHVGGLLVRRRLLGHLEAEVPDLLEGVGLAHVQGGDVGVTQPQALLQVGIALKNVLRPAICTQKRKLICNVLLCQLMPFQNTRSSTASGGEAAASPCTCP
jgi:hypothetical protein